MATHQYAYGSQPEAAPILVEQEDQVNNVIAITARLAQVLAQEADLLEAMNIKKVAELQPEKLLLTSALEREKRLLMKNRTALSAMTDADREDMRTVIEIFDTISKENYRRLLVARDVNQKMVEAIGEAVNDATANSVYDKKARPDHIAREQLSVTLNEKA